MYLTVNLDITCRTHSYEPKALRTGQYHNKLKLQITSHDCDTAGSYQSYSYASNSTMVSYCVHLESHWITHTVAISRDRSYTTWTQSASLCFMFTNPQVDSNILQRCDCENFISAVVISSITTNRCSICMMSQLAQTGFPMWYIVACASSSILFSSIINWSRFIRSALFRNL